MKVVLLLSLFAALLTINAAVVAADSCTNMCAQKKANWGRGIVYQGEFDWDGCMASCQASSK